MSNTYIDLDGTGAAAPSTADIQASVAGLAPFSRYGLYNFKQSNTRFWQRALGNVLSGTSHATIAAFGDSTTAGLTTVAGANMPPNSWMRWLSALIAGKGIPIVYDARFGDAGAVASSTTANLADTRVTLGSGWASSGPFGIGGASFYNNSTTNALAIAIANSFDTIDLWYIRNSGLGTFTVDVDGGAAAATIDSSGATALLKTTISVAAGTHTINIKRNGTGGGVFIVGVSPYTSGTKSIKMINGGAANSRAQNWSPNTLTYDPVKQIISLAADLGFINLGINDARNGRTKAQYLADMQAIITGQLSVGDAVIMVPIPSDTAIITAQTQSDYRDACYELAVTNDIPLIDLPMLFGPFASKLSGMMSDQLHGTTALYAAEAKIVERALFA